MSPCKQSSAVQRWWAAWPLNNVFIGITGAVLVFLCIVCALGVRQFLLYNQCQQAMAASDRLLFQFTTIKGHLIESLILMEDVNLQALNGELQNLEKEAESLSRNILVPESLKATLVSRADLVSLEVRLRAIQDHRPNKTQATAELVRSLNGINVSLQQFRILLSDYTQTILLGLHKIIAGALGLIVAMTCTLLFLLNRHLAIPVLNLCRLTDAVGDASEDHGRPCSLEDLTKRINDLVARSSHPVLLEHTSDPSQPAFLQQEALRYRYAAAGGLSSELASEMTNIINGVINYTQTLIDLEAQGDSRTQRATLYQLLTKEEKKIADLVGSMQLVSQRPMARTSAISLATLFTMLKQILDKPFRAESITFSLPVECRHEVQIPAGDLWLVVLTLLQSGRRALNHAFPGKSEQKNLSVDCVLAAQDTARLTLHFTNSAGSWPDKDTGEMVWPPQTFCQHLLQSHQATLVCSKTEKGHSMFIELPRRKPVA